MSAISRFWRLYLVKDDDFDQDERRLMDTIAAIDHDQHLLTTAEVAALVRAPASSVRYWRYLGTGPASFRVGRRVLYRRGVVLRWLEDRESQSATRDPAVRVDPAPSAS